MVTCCLIKTSSSRPAPRYVVDLMNKINFKIAHPSSSILNPQLLFYFERRVSGETGNIVSVTLGLVIEKEHVHTHSAGH